MPGPLRSRNFAIVDSGVSGASSWMHEPLGFDDVEHVAAVLRERGLRLLYDAPRRGTSGSRVNFIHPKDAGGVLVELVEPAAQPH